jgi:hypothetical protein
MRPEEIQPGRAYSGRGTPRWVIWMSADRERLQYDGQSVRLGARYPSVTTERFANWAKAEISADAYNDA